MKNSKQIGAIVLSTFLMSSVALSGCTTQKTVITSENSPNDFISKVASITNASANSDMQDILKQINQATINHYKTGYRTDEETHAVGLTVQDGQLATTETDSKHMDVRFGDASVFYELYEGESNLEGNYYGLLAYYKDSIMTVFSSPDGSDQFGKDNGKFNIETINIEAGKFLEANDDQMQIYIEEAISFPLENLVAGNLLVSPFEQPQAYSYKLEQVGQDYVWTISIHEQQAYNEILNQTFHELYGYERLDIQGDGSFILDEFIAQEVTYIITMNGDGVVRKVETTNASTAIKGEVTKEIKSTDTISLTPVDEKWPTFFNDFFAAIESGTLKEGDSFTLNQQFADSSSSIDSSQQSTTQMDSASDTQTDSK